MDPVSLEVRKEGIMKEKIKTINEHVYAIFIQQKNKKEFVVNVPVSGQQQHFRPFFDSRFTGHLLDFRLSSI